MHETGDAVKIKRKITSLKKEVDAYYGTKAQKVIRRVDARIRQLEKKIGKGRQEIGRRRQKISSFTERIENLQKRIKKAVEKGVISKEKATRILEKEIPALQKEIDVIDVIVGKKQKVEKALAEISRINLDLTLGEKKSGDASVFLDKIVTLQHVIIPFKSFKRIVGLEYGRYTPLYESLVKYEQENILKSDSSLWNETLYPETISVKEAFNQKMLNTLARAAKVHSDVNRLVKEKGNAELGLHLDAAFNSGELMSFKSDEVRFVEQARKKGETGKVKDLISADNISERISGLWKRFDKTLRRDWKTSYNDRTATSQTQIRNEMLSQIDRFHRAVTGRSLTSSERRGIERGLEGEVIYGENAYDIFKKVALPILENNASDSRLYQTVNNIFADLNREQPQSLYRFVVKVENTLNQHLNNSSFTRDEKEIIRDFTYTVAVPTVKAENIRTAVAFEKMLPQSIKNTLEKDNAVASQFLSNPGRYMDLALQNKVTIKNTISAQADSSIQLFTKNSLSFMGSFRINGLRKKAFSMTYPQYQKRVSSLTKKKNFKDFETRKEILEFALLSLANNGKLKFSDFEKLKAWHGLSNGPLITALKELGIDINMKILGNLLSATHQPFGLVDFLNEELIKKGKVDSKNVYSLMIGKFAAHSWQTEELRKILFDGEEKVVEDIVKLVNPFISLKEVRDRYEVIERYKKVGAIETKDFNDSSLTKILSASDYEFDEYKEELNANAHKVVFDKLSSTAQKTHSSLGNYFSSLSSGESLSQKKELEPLLDVLIARGLITAEEKRTFLNHTNSYVTSFYASIIPERYTVGFKEYLKVKGLLEKYAPLLKVGIKKHLSNILNGKNTEQSWEVATLMAQTEFSKHNFPFDSELFRRQVKDLKKVTKEVDKNLNKLAKTTPDEHVVIYIGSMQDRARSYFINSGKIKGGKIIPYQERLNTLKHWAKLSLEDIKNEFRTNPQISLEGRKEEVFPDIETWLKWRVKDTQQSLTQESSTEKRDWYAAEKEILEKFLGRFRDSKDLEREFERKLSKLKEELSRVMSSLMS